MKLGFTILGLLIFTFGAFAQGNNCTKLRSDQKTQPWYFETVTFEPKESYYSIHGTVKLSDKPVEDVFVEVFDASGKKRVDGCVTATNGRFSFPNLKSGRYLIRLSKSGGYELTEIKVQVSRRSRNKKSLYAIIEVGK